MESPPSDRKIKTKLPDVSFSNQPATRIPNQELANIPSNQNIASTGETLEPSVWRTIGRLLHEFLYLVFFIGLHFLLKWALTKTHQENEWWASYLLFVSIAYAVIAFTVIFGSELVVDCKHAIEFMMKHLRKK